MRPHVGSAIEPCLTSLPDQPMTHAALCLVLSLCRVSASKLSAFLAWVSARGKKRGGVCTGYRLGISAFNMYSKAIKDLLLAQQEDSSTVEQHRTP